MLNILLLARVTQWLYWMQRMLYLSQTNKQTKSMNIAVLSWRCCRVRTIKRYRNQKTLTPKNSVAPIPCKSHHRLRLALSIATYPWALSGSSPRLRQLFALFFRLCVFWDEKRGQTERSDAEGGGSSFDRGTERSNGGDGPWFLLRGVVEGSSKGPSRTNAGLHICTAKATGLKVLLYFYFLFIFSF